MTTIVGQPLPQDMTINQLYGVVENAHPQISFWGCRYIRCANGDSLLFSTLIDRTGSHMSRSLSEPQQAKVQRLATKIENLFSSSETLLARTNRVTRWFVYIRESLGANDDQSRQAFIRNHADQPSQSLHRGENNGYFPLVDTSPTDSKQTPSSYHMDPLEALLPPGIGEIFPL
jgi:hypothetical protein